MKSCLNQTEMKIFKLKLIVVLMMKKSQEMSVSRKMNFHWLAGSRYEVPCFLGYNIPA